MRAKKRFGQHFLNSEEIAERIASSLSGEGYSRAMEIGPGKGMLSKYLIKSDYQMYFVEADRDMVKFMCQQYPSLVDNIFSADVIRFDIQEHLGNEPLAIIGNFPYNISSQIVFKCIDHVNQIPELVGMFQLEMAQRIVAPPGSRTYGVISILTQFYYEGELLFIVEPDQFTPPPKVRSAVIRLRRKQKSYGDVDTKLFKRIVKGTFSQRRKMIRNTLNSILPKGTNLEDKFYNKRPEQLSVKEFVDLTNYCGQIINKKK